MKMILLIYLNVTFNLMDLFIYPMFLLKGLAEICIFRCLGQDTSLLLKYPVYSSDIYLSS